MGRVNASIVLGCLILSTAGCSTLQRAACRAGEQPTVSEQIYFGTDKPGGGTVSPEEWTAFLSTVVTPRFPAGLTVWSASGQWQSADGSITRENSYVLNLLHPVTEEAEAKVQEIVSDYKTRFRQEAVLRVRAQACMSL